MESPCSPQCVYCRSPSVNRNGLRKNGLQRHRCRACGRNFDDPEKGNRRQFRLDQVGESVSHFYEGMSCGEVVARMNRGACDAPLSRESINRWVVGYTKTALSVLRAFPALRIHSVKDWAVLDFPASVRQGGVSRAWFVVERSSSFILACHLSGARRSVQDAAAVLRLASEIAVKPPLSVASETASPYEDALRRVFPGSAHIVSKSGNGTIAEILPHELKEAFRAQVRRVRRMKNLERGLLHLRGWSAHFNFMGGHQNTVDTAPHRAARLLPLFPDWHAVVRLGPPSKYKADGRTDTGSGK